MSTQKNFDEWYTKNHFNYSGYHDKRDMSEAFAAGSALEYQRYIRDVIKLLKAVDSLLLLIEQNKDSINVSVEDLEHLSLTYTITSDFLEIIKGEENARTE